MSRHRSHRLIDQPIIDLDTHPATHVTANVMAEYLEVTHRTVCRLCASGALHAFKVGWEWRIPIAAARAAFPSKPRASTG